jgi:predicted nucleotidyltransferase
MRDRPYDQLMAESTLWGGKTLRQWLPVAVDDVVREVAPQRIVLFGSVARGDEGPDSDLDLLVIVDHLEPTGRARLISSIRRAISARAPIDVFVTDLSEYECRKDVIGSMQYWPAREGEVVYERAS